MVEPTSTRRKNDVCTVHADRLSNVEVRFNKLELDNSLALERILSALGGFKAEIEETTVMLREVKTNMDLVLTAFPPGAMEEHKSYHQRENTKEADSHELRKKVVENMTTWGMKGTIGVIFGAIVFWINANYGKHS